MKIAIDIHFPANGCNFPALKYFSGYKFTFTSSNTWVLISGGSSEGARETKPTN